MSNINNEEKSRTYLPSCEEISDFDVKSLYYLLTKISDKKCKEIDCNKDTTISDVLKKLNKRISLVNKYKKESIDLAERLTNNYVSIPTFLQDNLMDNNFFDISSLDLEIQKRIKNKSDKNKKLVIGYGYIYRILLDINTESFFHVYFNPFIKINNNNAEVLKSIIKNVTYDELLNYKTITKDEYEREIKELFKELSSND